MIDPHIALTTKLPNPIADSNTWSFFYPINITLTVSHKYISKPDITAGIAIFAISFIAYPYEITFSSLYEKWLVLDLLT